MRSTTSALLGLTMVSLSAPAPGRGTGTALPLHELVERSRAIVVGTVEGTRPSTVPFMPAFGLFLTLADLRVDQVLKGSLAAGETVPVLFADVAASPQPARYRAGERCLVFLGPGPKGSWSTVGLAAGKKPMSDPGAEEVWLARIREVVPLVAVPPPARSREALADWLVRCAESPHTRLEGAGALFPAAGAGGRGGEAPGPSLDEAQRARLAQAVRDAPRLCGPGDRELLRGLEGAGETRILARLFRELERPGCPEDLDYLEEICGTIAGIAAWPEGELLVGAMRRNGARSARRDLVELFARHARMQAITLPSLEAARSVGSALVPSPAAF